MSNEPFLDADPVPLLRHLFDHEIALKTFWIGKMSGSVPENLKLIYSKENLKRVYMKCRGLPKDVRKVIRFKDSLVNTLNLKKRTV